MELYYLEIAGGYVAPETPRGPPLASITTPGPGGASARTNTSARPTLVSAMCNVSTPFPSFVGGSLINYFPKHCKRRVRHTDSPYCGGACANLAKGERTASVRVSPPLSSVGTKNPITTKNPLQATRNIVNKPRIASPVTTGNGFGYVGPSHGTMIPPSTPDTKNDMSPVYWDTSPGQLCQTPGCASPVRVVGGYCGETHKQ